VVAFLAPWISGGRLINYADSYISRGNYSTCDISRACLPIGEIKLSWLELANEILSDTPMAYIYIYIYIYIDRYIHIISLSKKFKFNYRRICAGTKFASHLTRE